MIDHDRRALDFVGVPRSEIMHVSGLLATKLVANELVAYVELQQLMASPDALSKRGFTIASYALCGFANITSLAIEIGVVSALAPSRARLVARIGPSAVICGFLSTLQAAGIACVVVSTILPSSPTCQFVCADVALVLLLFFVCRAK
jgi:CNT family concentrative nucleoside transporter